MYAILRHGISRPAAVGGLVAVQVSEGVGVGKLGIALGRCGQAYGKKDRQEKESFHSGGCIYLSQI